MRLLFVVVSLLVLGACSVTSTPTKELAPKGMRCVEAHQEVWNDSDDGGSAELITVCDDYDPIAPATPEDTPRGEGG